MKKKNQQAAGAIGNGNGAIVAKIPQVTPPEVVPIVQKEVMQETPKQEIVIEEPQFTPPAFEIPVEENIEQKKPKKETPKRKNKKILNIVAAAFVSLGFGIIFWLIIMIMEFQGGFDWLIIVTFSTVLLLVGVAIFFRNKMPAIESIVKNKKTPNIITAAILLLDVGVCFMGFVGLNEIIIIIVVFATVLLLVGVAIFFRNKMPAIVAATVVAVILLLIGGLIGYNRFLSANSNYTEQSQQDEIRQDRGFHPNGVVAFETIYKNEEIQTTTNYYQNGRISFKRKYTNGIPDKFHLECNEFGRCENVFKEDFYDNNANGWWNFTNSDEFVNEIVTINQRKAMSMKVLKNRICSVPTHIPLTLTENFSIETTLEYKSGITNNEHGIIWGFQDWNNYYSFGISANGEYVIRGKEEGINITIKNWTATRFINKNKAKNTLKILRVGNKINFAINGNIVHTDTFREFRGSYIGFCVVEGKQEVLFENLIIKQDLPADLDKNKY